MNKKLEELSKKLEDEIRLKELAKNKEMLIQEEAKSAGSIGALSGALKGAIVGFLCGGFFLFMGADSASNFVGLLIMIIAIIIGGYNGYDVAYRSKRYK